MKIKYPLALLLTISACLVSCSPTKVVIKAYDGPDLPLPQLAILKPQVPLQLRAIDGDTTHAFDTSGKVVANDAQIMLLPGPHTLRLTLEGVQGVGTIRSRNALTATFVAEAGRKYIVRSGMSGQTWNPKVVDVTDLPPAHFCVWPDPNHLVCQRQ